MPSTGLPGLAPRWRKVLRDLGQHKARTALVVLAIAVGILGAGTVLDAWSLVRRATRGEYRSSNPASVTLRVDAIDAAVVDRLRALPALRDVEARWTASGSVRVAEGWRPAILFAVEDFNAIRIGTVKPEAGAWPPRDGELVVEASSVEFAGTAPGATLALRMSAEAESTLPVVGIARDVGLAPGWMEHVVYGFATRATLLQLKAPLLSELQLVVADRSLDREAVRRIAAEARSIVEGAGRRVLNVDVPVPGRHIHAAQIDSLLLTQGAFGVLAMLLSGILVVNLITAMMTGQVREIGIMKTLGAGSAAIATMYLTLALVLGLVACALAIPAAALAGRAYASFTAQLLNFDIGGFSIPASVLVVQLVVGALLPVVAAAFPVLHGCRIPVNDALRECGIDATRASERGLVLRRASGLPRPILISLRNAFRRRQRMVLTLIALATGGSVYLGALDLRAAIRASVDLLFSANRFDIALRLERPMPPEQLESLVLRVPGVTRTEGWGAARAALREDDGRPGNLFSISAPPSSTRMFAPAFRAGGWPSAGEVNALVVNRRLLDEEPRLAIGSSVTLIIAEQPSQWTVTGVVDTGPTPVAYTHRETLRRVTGQPGIDRLVIASAGEQAGTQLDLVQRLRAELAAHEIPVQSSQLMQQGRRVMEDHLLMVASFLGAMALLMIVVGGLGLGSTMSLGVLERTREIGVLRAIGARHRSILAMVQIEGLVLAILSWAIAVPLSIPMSLVLGWAFGRVMFPVPPIYLPQGWAVLQWLAVVLVVSVVACAWPALRAMRIPTAAALAYE